MTAHRSRPTGGRLNQDIANAIVRGHKRFLGRGPTKAQVFFRHNIVVVVMQDSLTQAERGVVARGGYEEVLQMRRRYAETMRDDLVRAVEDLTGCKVEAFISGHHIAPDLAAELFVLDRSVTDEPVTTEAV